MLVTDEDKAIFDEQDNRTLAEWWCALNRYDWPQEIPDEEPEVAKLSEWTPNNRRTALMGEIERRVGYKLCNRMWNINRMSDEEHEAWYSRNFRA